MKRFYLFLAINYILYSLIPLANAQSSGGNKHSLAIAYGYGKNKNENNFTPKGSSYKFIYGLKANNVEMSAKFGLTDFEEKINYLNIGGKLVHQDLFAGVQIGYWLFDRLKLHIGYGNHNISEFIVGNYSTTQRNTLESTYKLEDYIKPGLYGGGELILFRGSSYHLFGSYDYYHINQRNSHDWEVTAGLRFYMGASSSSSSSSSNGSNVFKKILGWMFDDK